MTQRKTATLQIVIALIFAAAMLVSSYLMKGSEHADTVTLVLIAVWWIPFSFLLDPGAMRCEARYLAGRIRSLFR